MCIKQTPSEKVDEQCSLNISLWEETERKEKASKKYD